MPSPHATGSACWPCSICCCPRTCRPMPPTPVATRRCCWCWVRAPKPALPATRKCCWPCSSACSTKAYRWTRRTSAASARYTWRRCTDCCRWCSACCAKAPTAACAIRWGVRRTTWLCCVVTWTSRPSSSRRGPRRRWRVSCASRAELRIGQPPIWLFPVGFEQFFQVLPRLLRRGDQRRFIVIHHVLFAQHLFVVLAEALAAFRRHVLRHAQGFQYLLAHVQAGMEGLAHDHFHAEIHQFESVLAIARAGKHPQMRVEALEQARGANSGFGIVGGEYENLSLVGMRCAQ